MRVFTDLVSIGATFEEAVSLVKALDRRPLATDSLVRGAIVSNRGRSIELITEESF